MTAECQTCGRPAENGHPTHWLGCEEVSVASLPEDVTVGDFTDEEAAEFVATAGRCEYEGCSNFKWSTGPRTKYCPTHKDPKSREN